MDAAEDASTRRGALVQPQQEDVHMGTAQVRFGHKKVVRTPRHKLSMTVHLLQFHKEKASDMMLA